MAMERALAVLKERFGFDGLYAIQREVIARVLGGGDALVVLPTGAGKSLIYQLPALVLADRANGPPGVTLVFSPLIALMEDQVSALRRKGIAAAYVNSTLDRRGRESRYRALARGDYELMYATPERMGKEAFVEALECVPGGVNLLAIDEAHCVSKWGHDLRPAYQEVGRFRAQLGCPTTIALTATATRRVRDDIRAALGLDADSMPLFASGLDRPNLSLEVEPVYDDDDKVRAIVRIADAMPGTGIVYGALIRDQERLVDRLRKELRGRPVLLYHGRLDPRQKKRVYDRFIEAPPSDGLVLVATNAFGMGVDKPDIRFIVHAQVPGSVEAYYQEVGRAGRDGEAARCVLLYAQDDLAIQQEFVRWKNPSAGLLVELVLTMERSEHNDFDADELRLAVLGKVGGDRRIEHALITLEKLGVVEATIVPERYRFARALRDDELDADALATKRQGDLERLYDIVRLTQSDDIRRFVLDYFDLGACAVEPGDTDPGSGSVGRGNGLEA